MIESVQCISLPQAAHWFLGEWWVQSEGSAWRELITWELRIGRSQINLSEEKLIHSLLSCCHITS